VLDFSKAEMLLFYKFLNAGNPIGLFWKTGCWLIPTLWPLTDKTWLLVFNYLNGLILSTDVCIGNCSALKFKVLKSIILYRGWMTFYLLLMISLNSWKAGSAVTPFLEKFCLLIFVGKTVPNQGVWDRHPPNANLAESSCCKGLWSYFNIIRWDEAKQ